MLYIQACFKNVRLAASTGVLGRSVQAVSTTSKYYNPPIYNTTGYIENYTGVASQLVPYPGVFNSAILSTVSAGEKVKLKDDIATLSDRLSKLRLEMSKRGIYSP